ncbi:unnamed protein product [Effrenium voratum]|uniref:Pentatricopeptide repeat-containing protein n=1 Tax=Effrenium voratum TaxID=2562239 RepID=A0AA36MRJ4_9DINO|nr:unnamed protein product [Effrenium voratum]
MAEPAALRRALRGCELGSRWQAALALLFHRPQALSLVACTAVLGACGRCAQWQLALQLLPLMRRARVRVDAVAFNRALDALKAGGRGVEAHRLLLAMPKAKKGQQVVAYNTTMGAYNSQQSWQQALALFAAMNRQTLAPSLASFLEALRAQRSGHQWQQALALRPGRLWMEACNAALAVCEAAAQWQQALHLAKQFGRPHAALDRVGQNTLLSAMARGGAWQKCLELLKSGLPPDVVSFNSALRGLEVARCWDKALALLAAMPAPNVISFNTAISACADGEGDHWQWALVLLERLQASLAPDLISFNAALACAAAVGFRTPWRAVLVLVEEMASLSLGDGTTLSTALTALASASKWRQMLRLEAAAAGPLELPAYTALARGAECAGAPALARALKPVAAEARRLLRAGEMSAVFGAPIPFAAGSLAGMLPGQEGARCAPAWALTKQLQGGSVRQMALRPSSARELLERRAEPSGKAASGSFGGAGLVAERAKVRLAVLWCKLEARESLDFPSLGKQAEGMKRTNPLWTLPKAGRDDVKKVFISKKMPQDLLGRGSPGAIYEPKRVRTTPSWTFGVADRPGPGKAKYPESSNDLTQVTPDSQPFKYGDPTAATIGTCPRDAVGSMFVLPVASGS